jgi:drug/metabolite transporter (DMT)-like permease
MPISAIFLLLLSATIHAVWNLLLKKSSDKYIAMAWQVIISGIISIFCLFFTGLPPRSIWIYVLTSMTLEAIYFILLSYAYKDHDFSLVYPMARGAAPALVVIWTYLFLREIPSLGGFLGIFLIICGLVIIGATSLSFSQESWPKFKGIGIALTISFVISIYTLIDGFAVKQGPSSSYGLSMFSLVPVITTPFVLRRYSLKNLCSSLRKQLVVLFLVGILGILGYLLALYAYSFAPVNYSESIREVSVVIGAFFGWHFLKEKLGKIRITGACVIFTGIVLIAIFG